MKNVKNVSKDGVIDNYPSFTEIVTNPKYKFNLFCSPEEHSLIKLFDTKWELVVQSVDRMCRVMYEIPFYQSYMYQPTQDPYDFEKLINIDGIGYVYDSMGRTYEVDYETFIKLTLVLYMSLLRIPLTDEQYKSYIKFRNSSSDVWSILD